MEWMRRDDFDVRGRLRRQLQPGFASAQEIGEVRGQYFAILGPCRHHGQPAIERARVRRELEVGTDRSPVQHFDQEEVAGAAAAVHRKIPPPGFETGECLRVAADRADQLPWRRFVIGDWPLLDGAHARFDEAAPDAFDEAAVPPVAAQQAEIERPRPGGVPTGRDPLVGPLHAEREGDVVGGADGEDGQRNVSARQRLGRSRNRAIAPGRDHQLRRRLGQPVRVALGIDHAHDLVTGARQRFPQGGKRRAMARAVIEEHRNSHVSQP
jgi:hypothetical protein